MCMEDIRLARNTYFRTTRIDFAASPSVRVPADAKRIGIVAAFINSGDVIAYSPVDYALINEAPFFATTLSSSGQTRMLRVEDYGQLIMAEVFIIDLAGVTGQGYVTELLLLET